MVGKFAGNDIDLVFERPVHMPFGGVGLSVFADQKALPVLVFDTGAVTARNVRKIPNLGHR